MTVDELKNLAEVSLFDPAHLWTPIDRRTGDRVRIPLDKVDVVYGDLFARRLGFRARVFIEDHDFEVVGIECGIPGCFCDTEIVEVVRVPEKEE